MQMICFLQIYVNFNFMIFYLLITVKIIFIKSIALVAIIILSFTR